MSHSSSPSNRNSIFGWVKNLKRGLVMLLDSVNEILDPEFSDHSPTKEHMVPPQSIPIPQSQGALDFNFALLPLLPRALEFLRPLLHHKLRLLTNVNTPRGRLGSNTNLSDALTLIRQHPDLFLQHNPIIEGNSRYFGVPLDEAINQALAKILIFSEGADDAQLYGRIPIVVAKCGVYLKKKGLTVEGIFRVGGSLKRLKELQVIFNTPPDFGKKLLWEGYNVHDAALILRRYLNALPEPLIPLDMYEQFRDPLRQRPRIINYMKFKAENPNKSLRELDNHDEAPEDVLPLTEANIDRLNLGNLLEEPAPPEKPRRGKNYRKLTRDVHCAIEEYKQLVLQLPPLSKQLLFYIFDLLAMVQNHADENLMLLRNLAAIFQPLILLHPDHDMDPVEYALSQVVVEFLIQYAYKLLPSHRLPPPTAPGHLLVTGRTPTGGLEALTFNVALSATTATTTPMENEHAQLGTPEPKLLAPDKIHVDTEATHSLTEVALNALAATSKEPIIVVSPVDAAANEQS